VNNKGQLNDNTNVTDVEEKLLKYLNNCNGHVFGLRPEGSKEI
jgi:hypothetical protein